MTQTLKRWIKIIKWLSNHLPVIFRFNAPQHNHITCTYCGALGDRAVVIVDDNVEFCICYKCQKKVFDAVLKPQRTAYIHVPPFKWDDFKAKSKTIKNTIKTKKGKRNNGRK